MCFRTCLRLYHCNNCSWFGPTGNHAFWNYNGNGAARNSYRGNCACGQPPLSYECTGTIQKSNKTPVSSPHSYADNGPSPSPAPPPMPQQTTPPPTATQTPDPADGKEEKQATEIIPPSIEHDEEAMADIMHEGVL